MKKQVNKEIMKNSGLSRTIKMVGKTISNKSPEILTGLGIAGMITTVVLAVRATPKAMSLIEEAEEQKDEQLTQKEVVQVGWKPYIPVAITGVASIGCLVGATRSNARKRAALYSAYKLSETALSEFKEKTGEVVSEKKMKEIKQKIAEDRVDKVVGKKVDGDDTKSNVIVNDDDQVWYIDPFTNKPFKSSRSEIDSAVNKVNLMMMSDMTASLSDLYGWLDIEPTVVSDDIGWDIDDGLIESWCSEAVVRDGKPYIVMDFLKRPTYGFNDKSRMYG